MTQCIGTYCQFQQLDLFSAICRCFSEDHHNTSNISRTLVGNKIVDDKWQWQWWQWICFYYHVIHIWKIQQIIYTRIHPRCYRLAQNSLKLQMAKGTGSRGLCAPISIIQGNCLMVLGKWRNAIKTKTNKKTTVQFVLFLRSLLSHNQ